MVVKHFSRLDASSSKCNMIGKYPAKKVQNVRWKFYQSIVSLIDTRKGALCLDALRMCCRGAVWVGKV